MIRVKWLLHCSNARFY